MDPCSKNNKEDHLEEYRDSAEYSPELDEAQNEVTDYDTHNKPVHSTSSQSFGFHRTRRPGFCGGLGRVQAVLLFFFASF